MINRILKFSLTALIAAAPLAAHAGFRVVEEAKKPVGQVGAQATTTPTDDFGFQRGRPAVREYGASPGRELRHGFGKDLPLSLVFQQIAPQGWSVDVAEGAQASRLISWQGGKPWTDVLVEVATDARVYADVDWERRKVSVTAPAAAPKATLATVTVTPATASVRGAATAQATVIAAPAAPVKKWVARGGRSLRSVVEEWAATEQWTVVWDAGVDYEIPALMSFDGDLTNAITKVFQVYANSKRPAKAVLYVRQQVIHVTE